MTAVFGSHDWRDGKIREWLLRLLRFAVTRKSLDQSSVLAVADELDAVGLRSRLAAPRFFLRTSRAVCGAILANGEGEAVLRAHIARIDDPRLRRAFQGAVGLRTVRAQHDGAKPRPGPAKPRAKARQKGEPVPTPP
ncbi:MAG TPA: hypothetical protein VIY51_20080 [Xanthobacteraceae bacterium]